MFHWIQRQFQDQFKFSRTADLNQEFRDLSVEVYNDMLKVAENKIYLIEDMLQISEQ